MSVGPSLTGSIAGSAGDLASLGGMAAAPFTGGASAAIPMGLKIGGTAASMGGGLMNSLTGEKNQMEEMQARQNQAQTAGDAQTSMAAANPSVNPFAHAGSASPLMQLGGTTTSTQSGSMSPGAM